MYTVNIYIKILTPTSGEKIYKWWRLLNLPTGIYFYEIPP